MSYDALNLHRISPHIGADVHGIDITRPLSNAQVDQLHRALGEYGVLFFRDQPFDHDSQKRFGRYFGDFDIHPNAPGPDSIARLLERLTLQWHPAFQTAKGA